MNTPLHNHNHAAAVVTVAMIEQGIKEAKKCHAASKDSATEAAAHAYLVWRETLAPGANPMLLTEMEKWITDRNEDIASHNKALSSSKTLSKEEKHKQRRGKIAAREGASPFTLIVKYVFDFTRTADASLVARYAKVLEWIDDKFSSAVVNDTVEIVDAVKKIGGFEEALEAARGKVSGPSKEHRDLVKIAMDKLAKQAVDDAEVKDEIDITLEAEGAVVALLGRYDSGKFAVIGERGLDEGEVRSWLVKFPDDIVLPVEARTEFVARVLDIGKIVGEGAVTEHTRHGTVVGEKLREERILTLRRGAGGCAELVVSACRATASAIFKATATAKVSMTVPIEAMVLDGEARTKLEAIVLDDDARSLVSIDVDDAISGGGNLTWMVANTALPEGSVDGKAVWQPLSKLEHKPLDEDRFRATFDSVITRKALKDLYNAVFAGEKWAETKAPKSEEPEIKTGKKKGAITKLAKLTFDRKTMVFSVVGKARTVTVPLTQPVKKRLEMQFRLRDLRDLFSKLVQRRETITFDIAGDAKCMLKVNWADDLGSYTICLPTADGDGRLVYARVAEIGDDAANDDSEQDVAA